MERSSNLAEEEVEESMTATEMSRMTDILRVMGLSDAQILTVLSYIASGTGLTEIEQAMKEEKD